MIRFSVADTALEGFRLTRENPAAVGVWAALTFVANLAGQLMVIANGQGAALIEAGAWAGPTTPSARPSSAGGSRR